MSKSIPLSKKFRTAFMIIAIAPVIAFGLISYFQLQHAVTSQARDLMTVSSQNKRIALDQYLNTLQEQSQQFARYDFLAAGASQLADPATSPEERAAVRAALDRNIRSRLFTFSQFNGVYLFTLEGTMIYSLPENRNTGVEQFADADFIAAGKEKLYISDIVKSPFTSAEAQLSALPLAEEGSRIKTILVFEINPVRLFDIMAERTGIGESGDTYLVNRDGLIISKTKIAQSAILAKTADGAGVRAALGGASVADQFDDPRGGTIIGSYVWYPRQRWVIVSEMHSSEANLFGWRLVYENVLLVLVLAVIIYFFSRYYAKKFAAPITLITGSAEVIAGGDLRERVTVNGSDELGRLGRSFNTMVDSLSGMNRQLQEMSLSISGAAQEILASSEEQEQISVQQSSAVSETSATIEELSVSAKQVAQSAQTITHQVEGTARKIMFLSEKAQEINKITTVIEEIAQQIHLLSLNASIEAARAGEHGKGFEVVASEIRKLSEKANKQTGDIAEIIRDIQDATSGAVLSTEQAVNGVRSITLSIQQQDVATNQISIAMGEINHGMRQSLEGTKQIIRAVESLHAITGSMRDVAKQFHV